MERIYSATSRDVLASAELVSELSDLAKIYGAIKEKCQKDIDNAFDRISKEVGFVVTMTVPVDLEFEKGKVKRISAGAENLKGTIFEKAMTEVLKPLADDPIPIGRKTGIYTVVVFWHGALMLTKTALYKPPWECCEMVQVLKDAFSHLDDRTAIMKEQVLASAIDQVYPELNFAQRLANSKAAFNLSQSNAAMSNLQTNARRFM